MDHSYSTVEIRNAIQIVLVGAVSFRACSTIIALQNSQDHQSLRAPAPNTIQSWVLRFGLYELIRIKEQASDWVLFIDHSCQLGHQKCLLILGIRLSHWSTLKRPLTYKDMTLILIEIVDGSNGDKVKAQLLEAKKRIGTIHSIVSDQGSDLVSGMKKLVDEQRTLNETPTKIFKDISHASSHIFKERLLSDPNWQGFLVFCGKTHPQVKQTILGSVAPPTQKVKGRYMNIGEMITWGQKMLARIDDRTGKLPDKVDRTQLEKKYGWIGRFRDSLKEWEELHEIREESMSYLRSAGYHALAASILRSKLSSLRSSQASQRMVEQIVELVREQSSGLEFGDSIPASTEILESLIGKGKQMLGQHSRGGFTKMILGMGAALVRVTEQTIVQSLEAVREIDLRTWASQTLGTTLTSIRRAVLNGTKIT